MSRQSGSPAARAGLLQAPPDGVGVQAEYRRGGVNYRILGADGQQSLNGSRSQVEDHPLALLVGLRLRNPDAAAAVSHQLHVPQRSAAASETRSSPSRMTEARAMSTRPRLRAYSAVSV